MRSYKVKNTYKGHLIVFEMQKLKIIENCTVVLILCITLLIFVYCYFNFVVLGKIIIVVKAVYDGDKLWWKVRRNNSANMERCTELHYTEAVSLTEFKIRLQRLDY